MDCHISTGHIMLLWQHKHTHDCTTGNGLHIEYGGALYTKLAHIMAIS